MQHGRHGRLFDAPVRYARQSLETWRILQTQRPHIVLVQNPPIHCVLLAYAYCRQAGAGLVIDSHTGAFLDRRWRWSLGIHRWISRRALTTIVTNSALREVVEGWGAPCLVLGHVPTEYPPGEPCRLNGRFNIAVISTFAPDEPLETVYQAAGHLPDVGFYVTGDLRRAPIHLVQDPPANVTLTDYLPDSAYIGLLEAADVVMDLTTRNHTLLLGGFEAVSLGKPLILSDWPVLQEYFSKGAVHVPNTAEGLVAGVRQAQARYGQLVGEIQVLRAELQVAWQGKQRALEALFAGC